MDKIRVATRTSALALAQTEWVIEQLKQWAPSARFETVPMVTRGDVQQQVPLSQVGGKGLFVSEIEQALLDERADIAVHSLKDVPAELASGLTIAGWPKREDPRDAFISRSNIPFADLPSGAVIGTSSLRRMAQIKTLRPDLTISPVRGNVDTRLKKLEDGQCDAIILAMAGLNRLGLADRVTHPLSVTQCLPAVGQGVLAIECRLSDVDMQALLARLTDEETKIAARAERDMLFRLDGSCQVPIGGYATVEDGRVTLRGLVGDATGNTLLRAQSTRVDPESVGKDVADQLLAMGARDILQSAHAEV